MKSNTSRSFGSWGIQGVQILPSSRLLSRGGRDRTCIRSGTRRGDAHTTFLPPVWRPKFLALPGRQQMQPFK